MFYNLKARSRSGSKEGGGEVVDTKNSICHMRSKVETGEDAEDKDEEKIRVCMIYM